VSAELQSVQRLLEAVRGAKRFVILPHNDPDPDAIAAAVALQQLVYLQLGIEGQILYHGIIGRAENRALTQYLGNPLRYVAAWPEDADCVALVDTQPGTGNNLLPIGVTAHVVIDHHPRQELTSHALFADVRSNVGATSTILVGYLNATRVEMNPQLATALFYGIKADTLDLGRSASSADVAAYLTLLPLVDAEGLFAIEHAQVPPEYFRHLDAALNAAHIYDGVVVSYIGLLPYPDLVAEVADLLSRLQHTRWVMCIGEYRDTLIISVRCWQRAGNAAQLIRTVVGAQGVAGGHGSMAAGHISLGGCPALPLAQQLIQRALQYLGVPENMDGKPLIT